MKWAMKKFSCLKTLVMIVPLLVCQMMTGPFMTLDGSTQYALVEKDGMEPDEAMEFIDYNTIRSLPYYSNHPIVFRKLQ